MRNGLLRLSLLGLTCLGLLTGATCADKATGTTVTKNSDGTTTVTQTPNSPVAVAGGVVGSLPLPFAGLIGAAITSLPGIWFAIRSGQYKNAAIATAAAAGKMVSGLPDSAAKTSALKVLDVVHDAAGIADPIQAMLQQTAAAHAGVPATT